MSTITNEQIEALRALVLRMSPGEWAADPAGYRNWKFEGGYRGVITTTTGFKVYTGPSSFQSLRGATEEETQANAEGIAQLKTLALALLEEITQLRTTLPPRKKTSKPRWAWVQRSPSWYDLRFCGATVARLQRIGVGNEYVRVEINRTQRKEHDDAQAAVRALRKRFGDDVPDFPLNQQEKIL